ncbi:MAG: AraC family ligand binding domain-containing protein, partial [Lachnospiraceae bacterium]
MKKLNSLILEQKEDAKHGETFFPVQKYITTLSKKYPVLTTHWHEEAEFTLVTGGLGTYSIDLVDYPIQSGDLIFVPPLLLHSASRTTCDIVSETYVFHMNFLGGNNTDICSTRYLIPLSNQEFSLPYIVTPKHPAYLSLINVFHQISSLYYHTIVGYELALKSLFLQVIFILLQYS